MVYGPNGREGPQPDDIAGREKRVCATIDERLRDPDGLGERIKEGTHTLEDVYEFHDALRGGFLRDLGDTHKKTTLVEDASEVLIADFKAFQGLGQTYGHAIQNYLTFLGEERHTPESYVLGLRTELRSALRGVGSHDEELFPDLLTCMWELRLLRKETYFNSLNAAKWAVLIASAVDSYNKKEGIEDRDLQVNPRDIFLCSLVQNYGMLNPQMPIVDGSDRIISDGERRILKEHGQVGLVMLDHVGIPKSGTLTSVVGSHNLPLEIVSAIASVAESFDALYFRRKYREKRLNLQEVFRELGINLFGRGALDNIQADIRKHGYRYTAEEARNNPLKIPYKMFALLFGVLDIDRA